jgi:hypothetical protein
LCPLPIFNSKGYIPEPPFSKFKPPNKLVYRGFVLIYAGVAPDGRVVFELKRVALSFRESLGRRGGIEFESGGKGLFFRVEITVVVGQEVGGF